MNALLVTEYSEGQLLSDVIHEAIRSGDHGKLYHKLTALAYFLSSFHNRTAIGVGVEFHQDCDYLDRLTEKLLKIRAIGGDEASELYWLRDQWRNQPRMWEDQKVIVHGDATPDNFLFGDGLEVITFDLERTKRADRVFDTGRIAGELKHFFMQATGNREAAEPFIGHFFGNMPVTSRTATARFNRSRAGRRSTWGSPCCALRATLDRAGISRSADGEAKECLRQFR